MNSVKPYVIGIDLGGTNTVFGIVDSRGNVLADDSIPTNQFSTPESFVEGVSAAIRSLANREVGLDQIRGIGLGAPNGNYYQGTVENPPNLPWEGIIPIAQMMTDELGIPTVVTNDANAAAMGEMIYGVARGMKNFIVITLGTGLGSGIVINGQMVYGHDGFAGELGHVRVVRGPEGRSCGCGRKGCLEAYCSATGVARTAREIIETTDRPTLLRNIELEKITSRDVAMAAAKGDEVAKEIFQFTGHMLGEACADFAAFSSPEAFIFFGGLTKAGDLLMKPIIEAYEEHRLYTLRVRPKFLISALMGANAAVLGASAMGWEL